ncbi:MAG: L,D-transpeptidase/peptidoglycan binding protein [Actinomycetota bacterium]
MVFRMQTGRVLRHMMLALLVIVGAVVIIAGLAFVGLDIAYANHVFKGVYVEGINIGSMSRAEAIEELRSELDLATLNSDLVLAFDGYTWPLPLFEIDAYVDVEATVDRAMEAGSDIPFYERWANRATFRGLDRDVELVIHYDRQKLDSFISTLETTIDRPPVDAEIRLEGRSLIVQRSQDGWKLDSELARKSVLEALSESDRTAELQIEVTAPRVSDAQVGKVIVVDKANHQLTLYSNMEIEKQYPVAVGMSSWPTPSGTFKVTSKQKNPTWVNPGTPWAKTMPPFIPAGPGNPLGTRAIGTSAPGVFIHGTYSSYSIGTNASHGCIRMYIKDSEDIFERVEVGIPVLIY